MDAQLTITSILFVVMLIVPGVFFKRFYFQGQFSKQFSSGLFADRLITSIFWGLVVQIITIIVFSRSLNITYDSNAIAQAYRSLLKNDIPSVSTRGLWLTLAYLIESIIIAFTLGTLLHKIVRVFKIDVKFQVFRFANQWNYYFRGDILDSRDFKGLKKGRWLSTTVDVVMERGDGENKMISGFLTQYTISAKTGELETIYLTNPRRYSKSTNAYKEIPGDCLIIPYNKIIDLNLTYTTQLVGKGTTAQSIIQIVFAIGVLSIFIFPWFFHVGITRTVFGILASLVAWLSLITLIHAPFETKEENKIESKAVVVLIIFVVLFTAFTLFLFHP